MRSVTRSWAGRVAPVGIPGRLVVVGRGRSFCTNFFFFSFYYYILIVIKPNIFFEKCKNDRSTFTDRLTPVSVSPRESPRPRNVASH